MEWDYRALSVLQQEHAYQFALPIEQWQTSEEPGIAIWQPKHSLMLVDVDRELDLHKAQAVMGRQHELKFSDVNDHFSPVA